MTSNVNTFDNAPTSTTRYSGHRAMPFSYAYPIRISISIFPSPESLNVRAIIHHPSSVIHDFTTAWCIIRPDTSLLPWITITWDPCHQGRWSILEARILTLTGDVSTSDVDIRVCVCSPRSRVWCVFFSLGFVMTRPSWLPPMIVLIRWFAD